MSNKDYYKLLGVSKKASIKEILDAYGEKMAYCGAEIAKYDPFNAGPGELDPFQLLDDIDAAILVLGDPEKRKSYDASL